MCMKLFPNFTCHHLITYANFDHLVFFLWESTFAMVLRKIFGSNVINWSVSLLFVTYFLIRSIFDIKLRTLSKQTGFDQWPSSLKCDPTIIAFAPRYCPILPSSTPEPIRTGILTDSLTHCISFKLVASAVVFPVRTTPSERKNSAAWAVSIILMSEVR